MLDQAEVRVRSGWTRRVAAYAVSLILTGMLALFIAVPSVSPVSDQDGLGHFIGFALVVMPAAALHPRSLIVLVPVFLLFGATVELIQPLVGREGDWADMASNACGLAAGALIGLALHKLGLRRRA